MKNKILLSLASIATVSTVVAPLSLTSCSKKKTFDINIAEQDKIGYIIAVTKPYFEYHLTFRGLVAGDVISTRLYKSQNKKVKVHEDWVNHQITEEEAAQGYVLLKIIPSDPSPSQDVFSDIFSLTFTLLHDNKVCLEKTINNFSLDVALPTTPDLFITEKLPSTAADLYVLKGFNMDRKDDILKCGILVIPSNIYSIDNNAFDISKDGYAEIFESIKWILLDETLTGNCTLQMIGDSAFAGCPFTETLYIPSTVKYIGFDAFAGCQKFRYLEFLGVNSPIYNIEERAFNGTVFGGILSLPKGDQYHYLKPYLFGQSTASSKNVTGIVIPKNITQFGTESLAGFKKVEYIDLSDYTTVPSNFQARSFYNFPIHGTIYVNNEGLIPLWTKAFRTKVDGAYVFPDFANGTWEVKVK